MVRIPQGTFIMGCVKEDAYCGEDEKPAHKVKISSFMLDAFETTQQVYEKAMGENPSVFNRCGANCPVEGISWKHAAAFCEKAGKRLPTEAEWEYAARAGSNSVYYWGDRESDDHAWHRGNSAVSDFPGDEHGLGPHPVGQKKPNAWGLYDMSGNVEEWVRDWYLKDYFNVSPQVDPKGPQTATFKTLRGGSWQSPQKFSLRLSNRYGYVPGNRKGPFGVRCARDVGK